MVCLVLLLVSAAGCVLAYVKPIEEVVRGLGYPIETHPIHTKDGYTLTYHRLPHGRGKPPQTLGKPVLYVPGILQSSATMLAKENGLAYALADAGLDVWLSNYRGNMYSRRHDDLDSDKDYQFWDYTLHELGTDDLSASIDYIIKTTGYKRIFYIGFSMGTTMFWILASSWHEYLPKVEAMVAIAPVARPSYTRILINWPRFQLLKAAFTTLWRMHICEFLPYGETVASFLSNVCNNSNLGLICKLLVDLYNFLKRQGMDIDTAMKLIPYSPAGVSLQVLLHYMQIAKSGRFKQYDYGPLVNREFYDSNIPPAYNLTAITTPVYFVYSDRDEMASPVDVEWLAEQLPRRPTRLLKNIEHFRHIDFNLNHNLTELLTIPLRDFVKQLAEEGVDKQTISTTD